MTLKELRLNYKLTQQEAAKQLGISLRSYVSYENEQSKSQTMKYRYMIQEMERINRIDEEKGILTIEDIEVICADVFSLYRVRYAYLFGSYAKSKPNEKSDVDLLVSSDVKGLKFYEMVEKLRERLHKKVDVLDIKQLASNEKLLDEVLRSGVKIYG